MRSGYEGLSSDGESNFPATPLNIKELIFFRSWQAQGLVKLWYYVSIAIAIVQWIMNIINYTQTYVNNRAGGFFYGFFVGFMYAVTIIVATRIAGELLLAVFVIRDSISSRKPRAETHVSDSHPVGAEFTYASPPAPYVEPGVSSTDSFQ
eukprot:TRINITY_DN1291_c0_g1_i1.p1 TRINITY_DN1291_c0_g1~~TRINITY_DN1291_c0_g1_i1.p1  ORF type:complete len:150 (-),score=8.72 TRINITY_DN1291_c0_g1_i1:38-487(-)